jgi:hypothetical protein
VRAGHVAGADLILNTRSAQSQSGHWSLLLADIGDCLLAFVDSSSKPGIIPIDLTTQFAYFVRLSCAIIQPQNRSFAPSPFFQKLVAQTGGRYAVSTERCKKDTTFNGGEGASAPSPTSSTNTFIRPAAC